MTWAPQETQKVIYDLLSTDATLQTLIGGTVGDTRIYDRVPNEKDPPFVTIGDISYSDRGNHTWEGLTAEVTINVWYREPNAGRKQVQNIQKRIDELLHKSEPCIEGWNIVSFRRSTINILLDPDNITFHGIQKFNLLIGEA
jgi:hypothetical protein